MYATGEMYLRKSKRASRWHIEYLCPKDNEIIRGWASDADELTQKIAKEVLGAGENDEL
jgi:Uri superfamily endonuclease